MNKKWNGMKGSEETHVMKSIGMDQLAICINGLHYPTLS